MTEETFISNEIAMTSTQVVHRLTNRFRNFRVSVPYEYFKQIEEKLLKHLNDKQFTKYFRGQEEISDNGFHHVELFINTLNSYTASAIGKRLSNFS